jgi:hypothetical protein
LTLRQAKKQLGINAANKTGEEKIGRSLNQFTIVFTGPTIESFRCYVNRQKLFEKRLLARGCGRQNVAWGGTSEASGTPGESWNATKPTKWATALKAVAHFVGCGGLY